MDLKTIFIIIINCCIVWALEEDRDFFDKTHTFNPELLDSLEYDSSEYFANSQQFEAINFEPASDQPRIKGSIKTYYPDTKANLIVDYVADKTGYRASFKIAKNSTIASTVSFETRLTANSLKSLAG